MTGAILNHLPGKLRFLLRIHALVAMILPIKWAVAPALPIPAVFSFQTDAPEILFELGANSQRK